MKGNTSPYPVKFLVRETSPHRYVLREIVRQTDPMPTSATELAKYLEEKGYGPRIKWARFSDYGSSFLIFPPEGTVIRTNLDSFTAVEVGTSLAMKTCYAQGTIVMPSLYGVTFLRPQARKAFIELDAMPSALDIVDEQTSIQIMDIARVLEGKGGKWTVREVLAFASRAMKDRKASRAARTRAMHAAAGLLVALFPDGDGEVTTPDAVTSAISRVARSIDEPEQANRLERANLDLQMLDVQAPMPHDLHEADELVTTMTTTHDPATYESDKIRRFQPDRATKEMDGGER
jgi:hypothetical protein